MVRALVIILLTCVLVPFASTGASAQLSDAYRGEVHAFGGYAWTWSQGVYDYYTDTSGELDIKDNGFWAVAVDLNTPLRYGLQLELLYDRQSSELTFADRDGTRTIADINVEYMHVGGVQMLAPVGSMVSFTSLTFGATRFSFDNPTVAADVAGAWDDIWKVSAIVGLGVKYYAGDRVGLRFQGRLPITMTGGGIRFGVGTAGTGLTVGANGITQIDVSGGVFVTL